MLRSRCRAGLERDRGVDETGHQIAIFGRIGSRPFNAQEMAQLYLGDDNQPWYVSDAVDGPRGIASKALPWRPNRIWDQQVPADELDRARRQRAGLPVIIQPVAEQETGILPRAAGVSSPSLQAPRRLQ